MTMFVRAFEAFLGRVVILLVICLVVLVAAYYGAQHIGEVDFSNQAEGFWFQLKLAWSNVVEFFRDIYLWSIGR